MPLNVLVDPIPVALRRENRWLVWREVPDGNRIAKKPLSKVNDPSTWITFKEAVRLYRAGGVSGIGFVLGDGWGGVDLDYCYKDGKLIEDARPVIESLKKAYCEVSPSENGMKAFFRSELTGFEIRFHEGMKIVPYSGSRYYAVTGHGVGDVRTDMTELVRVWTKAEDDDVPDFLRGSTSNEGWEDLGEGIRDVKKMSDEELLHHAYNAANKVKFTSLYVMGDITGYASHSEADCALCCLLMFWTQRDVDRVERLFTQSALYRPRKSRTYIKATLYAALNRTDRIYEPLMTGEEGYVLAKGRKWEMP